LPTLRFYVTGIKDWKQDYLVSVRDLEQITSYNFFSNLPQNIQDIIETLSPETIKQKLNLMGISASLLADPKSDSTVVQVGSFIDLPMTQSGMPDQGAILITRTSGGISQIGINPDRVLAFDSSQIGIDQNSPAQIGSSQIGSSQIGSSQNSRSQVSTSQIGIPQIGESQTTVTKTGSKQIGSTQVAVTQFNPEQVSTTQVNSPQIQNSFINFPVSQFDPLQSTSLSIGRIQIDSSKVAFASSVSLQQLLSSNLPSHELVSTYLQQFQSTLATDWNLPTSFNLTFNITDLPTGQLAEGTITGYDTNNRPNSGTLTLDTDGNGLGWFIDTTPDDSINSTKPSVPPPTVPPQAQPQANTTSSPQSSTNSDTSTVSFVAIMPSIPMFKTSTASPPSSMVDSLPPSPPTAPTSTAPSTPTT
jgi:hypothetical protein